MKKLTLATTALYLSIASVAFADSNTLDITQASVGTAAPTTNFTQSGTSGLANITQTGLNTITGVQLGIGAQFTAVQQNPTSGTANAINYTGRGNSNVTVYQRATDGVFTASGSAGNTANIDMAANLPGSPANALMVDQVGYNNTATVYDTFAGYAPAPTLAENIQVTQYSDNAAAGNLLQIQSAGVIAKGTFLQEGGNTANLTVIDGSQNINLTQTNTADNAALGNVANLTIAGAGFNWTQTGTDNNLTVNLHGTGVNAGLYGWQDGTGNMANITQNVSYQDSTTGHNTVEQTGTDNIAVATQTSTHNSVFTIQQDGIGNNALINQSGTSNSALIQQTGNNNSGTINQNGTSNIAQIIQATSNNVASITQNGTGITTIIHQ